MSARILTLAALALASLARAAPAPFLRAPAPPQPDVEIRGSRPDLGLIWFARPVIASEAAYRDLAAAWGIKEQPQVDFRTHILVVAASEKSMRVQHELDGHGDLRVSVMQLRFKCEEPPDRLNYHIKSFPRRGIRTVNGVAVPPR